MSKMIRAIDLSMPDHHFYHRKDYSWKRADWISTGSVTSLKEMLERIRYAPQPPSGSMTPYMNWDLADDWNDGIFSRRG